jgi:putative transposase
MVVVVDGYSTRRLRSGLKLSEAEASTPEVVFETGAPDGQSSIGKIAGFDFGVKTFLTCSEGFSIESPLFLKSSLNTLRRAYSQHSKKPIGSTNREQARKHLVRCHEAISNRRRDWQWKLAHKLTDQFDVLCFETLNLKGMQRLWGRKVNDLALGDFLQILEWVAKKKGKRIIYIDRWYLSTKTCSCCGHVLDELDLSVRRWRCPSCHQVNDRDENAAVNIKTEVPPTGGTSVKRVGSATLGVGDVRQSLTAISV